MGTDDEIKSKIEEKIKELEREIEDWRILPHGAGIVDTRYPSRRKDQIVWRQHTIKVLEGLLA